MNTRIHTVTSRILTPVLLACVVAGLTGCPDLGIVAPEGSFFASLRAVFSHSSQSASCNMNGSPLRGLAALPVQFHGQATAIPPHVFENAKWRSPNSEPISILKWEWQFGDGTTGLGQHPAHTYANPGKYTVTLKITVSDGTQACQTRLNYVEVLAPPVADAGDDTEQPTGTNVQLNGTRSYSPTGQTLQYTWSFEQVPEGSNVTDGSLSDPHSPTPTFTPDRPGEYRLRLKVFDGNYESEDTVIIVAAGNRAPVANAGPDQTKPVQQTIVLDGSASYDLDGDSLTYAWTFVSRPQGSTADLSSPTAVSPTFTLDRSGQYVLQLIVNDGTVDSTPDTVTISTENSPPVANAGPDQTKRVGQTVSLDGTGSTDVDGDILTYQWSFVSVPDGPQPAKGKATLSDPTSPTPSFVIDRPGQYVLQLVVNDGHAESAPDTVVITTENTPPVANAGPDQTRRVTNVVRLDGTGSTDVDGDPLTYRWSTVSSPSQIPQRKGGLLDDPTSPTPSFTITLPGQYVFQLIVNDGSADSAPDTVVITTENSPPVADAGPDQTQHVGDGVQLNGTGSTDVDGDPLTYQWSFISVPPAPQPDKAKAALDDPTSPTPSFTIDRPGQYILQLIVNDGYVDSAPDTVVIDTENSPPVANAGPDQTQHVTDTVQLDGTGSTDVDGDTLTYSWSFVSRPGDGGTKSVAVLSDPTAPRPTFTIDLPGQYVLQLIVNDGTVDSAPDTVVITTENSPPVADAGPDQSHPVGTIVQLDGSGSHDPDGDPLTYSWSVLSSPGPQPKLVMPTGVTLSDSHAQKPTFTITRAGQYVFQLIVNDGTVDSAPDTVTISTSNSPPVANAGPDQALPNGSPVTLTGAGSSDVDGDPLTFEWSLTSRPAGSAAALVGATSVTPTFTTDKKGTYVAQLIVNDGTVDSAPDTVAITAQNRIPVADAGSNGVGMAGQAISLNGTGSSDADGDSLTYAWTIVTAPSGSTATIGDPTSATPSITPDRNGDFTFQLIVNDGEANSLPVTVTYTVAYPNPIADAGEDETFYANPELAPVSTLDSTSLLSLYTRMSEYKGAKGGWDAYTGALLDVLDPTDGTVKDTVPIVTQWAHIYPTNAAGLATNPATGEAWALLHMAPCDMVGGMGPAKGLSSPPEALVRLDIQTGMATIVGYLSTGCTGLAITEDGALYTLSEMLDKAKGGPTLYQINRDTAALTDLGSVSLHLSDSIAGGAAHELYRVFGNSVAPSGVFLDTAGATPDETPMLLPEDSDGWNRPSALARNAVTGLLYLATENEADNGSTLYAFTPAEAPAPKANAKETDGWYMNPYNGHRYKLLPASSWQDARDAAIAEGAHLVVLNDETEYQWIQRMFPQILWLGFQDLDLDRTWDWVASSSFSVYWSGGTPPALSVPTAGAMDPGYWGLVGRDASTLYQGLAEKESETVTQSPSRIGSLQHRSDGLGFAWTTRAGSIHVEADGSGSSEPLGNPLTYAWVLTSRPVGSNATLTGADTATPSFDADIRGDYTLELTVTTIGATSATDTVTFTYGNTKPVANAGPDQISLLLQDFPEPYESQQGLEYAHMDGTGSSDADHDALTYTWTVISKPDDSSVGDEWLYKASFQGITDDSSPVLRVLPDMLGDYVFELIVNDGFENSDPVQVTLRVQPNLLTQCVSQTPYDYDYFFRMGPRSDEVTTYSIPSGAPELPAFTTGGMLFAAGVFEITNAQYAMALNYAYSLGMLDPFPTDGSSHDAYFGGKLLLKTSGGAAAGEYCDIEFDGRRFIVAERDGMCMLQFPVVNVTWYGALAFCDWISTSSDLDERYDLTTWTPNPSPPPWMLDETGYRLPTEQEWEYAAAWQAQIPSKAGKHWIFGFWSDTISDASCNYNSANPLDLTTTPYTTPVGYYDGNNPDTDPSASYFGLYDASGNVWEWVWDAAMPYEPMPAKNGGPTFDGNSNVVRGGGWRDAEYYQRTAYRRALFPQTSADDVGFRVVRNTGDCGYQPMGR